MNKLGRHRQWSTMHLGKRMRALRTDMEWLQEIVLIVKEHAKNIYILCVKERGIKKHISVYLYKKKLRKDRSRMCPIRVWDKGWMKCRHERHSSESTFTLIWLSQLGSLSTSFKNNLKSRRMGWRKENLKQKIKWNK